MRTVLSLFVVLLFVAGCGGSDNVETPSSGFRGMPEPDPRPTTWQEGVFAPSDDFDQVCADLSKAYDRETAVQGTYVDENNWLRSWSHENYLWYDEIEDVDPACCTTPEYFELMKTDETTSSGEPKDKFHYSIPTEEFIKASKAIEVGYGAEFRAVGTRDIRVAYIEPSSPASIAGLSRGTRILEADGVNILTVTAAEDIDRINAALSPSEVGERHTFTVQDLRSSRERSVTMTAREINKDLVQNVGFLTMRATGERIGYMLFNSHDEPAGLELIEAVQYFEANDIDDLVLDLRYNGGGLVWIAQMLSSMVAGPAKTGQIFLENRMNDKHESSFSMFDLKSGSYGYGVDGRSVTLPNLGLPRLFVLVGPETCSASESIINGLRGSDVEIILIGSTTCGKPYGFVPAENCGTVYHSIDTHFVNAKGFGDYADGFPPSCRAADNFSYDLGDGEENLLATALLWILNGRCPSSTIAGGKSRQSEAAAKTALEPEPENTGPAITLPTKPPGAIIDPPGSSENEELIEIPPFKEEQLQE